MKSCLIVIDAQESFRHRAYWSERVAQPYFAAQNALIEGCLAAGLPIVRVFHVEIDRRGSQLLYFGSFDRTGLPLWATLPVVFICTAAIMAMISDKRMKTRLAKTSKAMRARHGPARCAVG